MIYKENIFDEFDKDFILLETTDDFSKICLHIITNQLSYICRKIKDNPIEKKYEKTDAQNKILFKKLGEFEFSVRSENVLREEGIIFMGDLVQKTESELIRYRNLGRKSIREIKQLLNDEGLSLGIEVPEWVEFRNRFF